MEPTPAAAPQPTPTPPPPAPGSVAAPPPGVLPPLTSWPGAFAIYKYSKQAVMHVLGTVVSLALILIGIDIVISLLFGGRSSGALNLIGELIVIVAASLISPSIIHALLEGVQGRSVVFGDALRKGMSVFLKFLGLLIVLGIVLMVALVVLIIPYLIIMPRLILAPYFLVDQDLGIGAALSASWHATKGNAIKVWAIIGVSILMALPMITIIGTLLTLYWLILYSAAWVLLYTLLKGKAASVTATAAPVAPATPTTQV